MYFIESSEEETVADTEENKSPPKQKRRRLPPAEDGASSGVSAVRHSSKGEFFHFFYSFIGVMSADVPLAGLDCCKVHLLKCYI